MPPPSIPKVGAAGFNHQVAMSDQARAARSAEIAGSQAGVRVSPATGDPSIVLLEALAGRVAEEAAGQAVQDPPVREGDTDPGYRVQIMSWIVGSLAQVARSFQLAAAEAPEEPAPAEDETAAERVEELQAGALPGADAEQPVALPSAGAAETAVGADATVAYGQDGAAQGQAPQGPKVDRWA